uniref:Uncharacterized protein n=1 Tax=viral metagenome TaxID=1070528 RepID=A0A6M3KNW6_9ZZZZ
MGGARYNRETFKICSECGSKSRDWHTQELGESNYTSRLYAGFQDIETQDKIEYWKKRKIQRFRGIKCDLRLNG